ncbi:LysR family transcriptional regulator [Vibrio salinus]|uniref:LysR family transcriptional regulator n=1 Tax=Vibrio salinus TaxID=2899784 RepID=UPI001E461F14|nr:LysR family transcriptional regulator [Vibrio salinus]MCE0495345.1 LysR family transcriptional regulator [Vibrio salinus]
MSQTKLISLLPDLAVFILIVQEGSFTAAAKKLDNTPSALSKLITRLEKALSVKLFERTTRSLVITQTGQKVYEQSVIMVNAAQQAIEVSMADHQKPSGSLTVSAPEAFLFSVLQPFVIPFLQKYPDIQLKLRAVDGKVDLIRDNIDVAFRLTDKPDEKLVLKEICKTNLVLCASPDYLNRRGEPKHPEELSEHDCLYLAETAKDNLWTFIQNDSIFSVEVSGRYALNHSQMRLNGVKSGLGIGIFHDFVVKDAIESGEVIRILEPWMIQSNYHGAIVMQYAQTRYMPVRLRVFINFMASRLKERFT